MELNVLYYNGIVLIGFIGLGFGIAAIVYTIQMVRSKK